MGFVVDVYDGFLNNDAEGGGVYGDAPTRSGVTSLNPRDLTDMA